MKVFIERENKTIECTAANGIELLKQLNIPESTVLVVKNNEVVLAETELSETDDVKILSVISGG